MTRLGPLAGAWIALLCAAVVMAQPGTPAIRIISPGEDAYVSGPVRLVAVMEPPTLAPRVTQVTFFADGRRICTAFDAPFQCDWDAGNGILEHLIRAVASLRDGRRLV